MAIRHTDILVVGGELSGAVAAAVCARAGRRVVVLEDGEAREETLGGLVVPPLDDLCPNLDALPRGMAPLEVLGQRQDLKRILPVAETCLQVVHPQHRLDLFVDPVLRRADLVRESPLSGGEQAARLDLKDPGVDAAFSVMESLDTLTVDGFFAGRKNRAGYRQAFQAVLSPPSLALAEDAAWLKESLAGALPFLTSSMKTPPLAAQRLLRALMAGVHVSPVGARRTLRAHLLDVARQRGAEVVNDDRANAFVVDGGRISEVRLSGRSDALTARVIIDATIARDVRDRVSPEKHARKLDAITDLARAAQVRVGVSWVVKRAGLPPGIRDHVLLSAAGDGPGNGAALLCCTRDPLLAESRKPQPGLVVLTACVVTDPAYASAAVTRLEDRLHALFPFTRRHIVEARSTAPDKLRTAPALYDGPDEPALLGGRGWDGGLKALFRAGRDVAPVLGFEGELWAGHAVATRVERLLSRRPLFRSSAEESQGAR
jgi:phytoene dehydrogenase-like protein